jgi:hypothetical protein
MEARATLAGSGSTLTVERSAQLAAIWTSLWVKLEARVDSPVRARLAVLKASTDGAPD